MSKADFLFELGTEELPPNALTTLSTALEELLFEALDQQHLNFNREASCRYATPRRLAIFIADLQQQQADSKETKLGPAVKAAFDADGKPTKAAEGFARGHGVPVSELGRQNTDKGERLCFEKSISGRSATELLPTLIEECLAKLPIPKRMRWGASRVEFVRPIHWVTLMMGDKVIDGSIFGIQTSNKTYGHRFHAPSEITLNKASDYSTVLTEKAYVIASFDKRKATIKSLVEDVAKKLGGNAIIDPSLLNEVTALVEYPVALAGRFDETFLSVPQEALIYSMSEHQKYFHLLDANNKLMPHFITVSNIDSTEPEKVISGNERVIRPRLADAVFFFETDKKTPLSSKREKLRSIVFQQSLGSVFDKTERVANLAAQIAVTIGGDADHARTAAELSKADLVSDMVLEFDKMQGVAGRYYAEHEGLAAPIAKAIEEHYLPRFADDKLPSSATSSAVALADRLDTLTGIFGIGQEPSGSKDPFALRRACIGILNILLKNQYTVNIRELLVSAAQQHKIVSNKEGLAEQVQNYLYDRFATMYQEKGIETEVFQSVRAKAIDSPLDFDARVKAVHHFNQSDDAIALAAANKRVSNMLDKTGGSVLMSTEINEALLQLPEEKQLFTQLAEKELEVTPLFANSEYSEGLSRLTVLREAVDAFFDKVMVNVEEADIKANRIALLIRLRELFLNVADISLLATSR